MEEYKYYYALTLKKVRGNITADDYAEYMNRILLAFPQDELDLEFHYEGTRGLHIHAMISSVNKMQWQHLRTSVLKLPKYGWSSCFKECNGFYGAMRWRQYMRKCVREEDELLRSLTKHDEIEAQYLNSVVTMAMFKFDYEEEELIEIDESQIENVRAASADAEDERSE